MIRFIAADLRRLWLGAVVVVLLVALATALGVTVTLQERALRLGSARAADKFDLVIGAAGSETQLVLSSIFLQPAPLPLMPGEVLAKLSKDPRVAWVAPVGFGDSFAGYPLVGTTRALIGSTVSGFAAGRMFEKEGEAVVGAAVKLPVGAEIKPMHGTAAMGGETHAGVVYHVTGKLPPTGTPWDRAILVPIQAVWHVHGLGHDHEHEHEDEEHHEGGAAQVTQAAAAADEHADEDHDHHGSIDADAAIDENFAADAPGLPAVLVKPKTIADAYKLRQEYRNGNTLAVFPGEVLTSLYATLGDAKMVLSAVAAGSQGLVAAALVLVTITHIGQRRRQIGALRAFGAPRLSVFAIVWFELFLLVALGIGLGFLTGLAAARLIANAFTVKSGIILPVGFVGEDLRMALILLTASAVLSAVPAVLAYRQSPAAALRA
ncbi:ABC-type antimicrobial peptide transport system permease component [Neorhizobium galegae bv. officinalis bv. officinalis str. HAMBI 1141]|uniref:ABC-type antimicrobial peptide transport system permease component n=1 Tax=Neorhizobium galegae bv. officinalis bv. officinalis str. HAMBI 1141 TaxID=1028801 RepID=A0A068TDD6_NEOGA|nr:ABC transporter permease [Neorhizobium galegae]CDN56537.1 ABC-type antimicrobial peptide transport system permease component [Neorhizobium galegae bv. officinalis bv. officinalis str. HAMBI 1141]